MLFPGEFPSGWFICSKNPPTTIGGDYSLGVEKEFFIGCKLVGLRDKTLDLIMFMLLRPILPPKPLIYRSKQWDRAV